MKPIGFHLCAGLLLLVPCLSVANNHKKLEAIVNQSWVFKLKEDPLFATEVGDHRYNNKLPAMTEQDEKRRYLFYKKIQAKLDKIQLRDLNKADTVSYDIFRREIENAIAEYEFKAYLMPFNADSGFYSAFASLPAQMPFKTVQDYDNYIARLNAFKIYMDQQITLMRAGLETGISQPRVILEGLDDGIKSYLVNDMTKSRFFVPFAHYSDAVPEVEQVRLSKAGIAAIQNSIVPAYQALLDFMLNEYMPKARTEISVSVLPNGKTYYTHLIKRHTTLETPAEDIHHIGLDEVKRIRAEMQSIIKQLEFKGEFKAFITFLRTDPQFYAPTERALLKEARDIAKRMDARLPRLFKTFPRMPYGVEPVPADIAPKYTTGRYVGTSSGSTEPGYYWVNTYALDQRPLYSLTALTLHEAVPGHHFQISLAKEMESIPTFRRFIYIPAFGEGWGLYSEKLGIEVGMYEDLYSDFGRLTYEMWRACRLVVDTGIHAMGWTRTQAMDFMSENTALSLHNIRTETDRYISWPAQALAYKLGELKIIELRKKAESILGGKFDIREFHHAVLKNGSVPLPLLEQQIDDYIQEAR